MKKRTIIRGLEVIVLFSIIWAAVWATDSVITSYDMQATLILVSVKAYEDSACIIEFPISQTYDWGTISYGDNETFFMKNLGNVNTNVVLGSSNEIYCVISFNITSPFQLGVNQVLPINITVGAPSTLPTPPVAISWTVGISAMKVS